MIFDAPRDFEELCDEDGASSAKSTFESARKSFDPEVRLLVERSNLSKESAVWVAAVAAAAASTTGQLEAAFAKVAHHVEACDLGKWGGI